MSITNEIITYSVLISDLDLHCLLIIYIWESHINFFPLWFKSSILMYFSLIFLITNYNFTIRIHFTYNFSITCKICPYWCNMKIIIYFFPYFKFTCSRLISFRKQLKFYFLLNSTTIKC